MHFNLQRGTHRATPKFRILQHETFRALQNNPNSGPFTFIAKCLYIIPLLGPIHREGFSHMIISTLRHFKNIEKYDQEFQESKKIARRLLVDILAKKVVHEERILRFSSPDYLLCCLVIYKIFVIFFSLLIRMYIISMAQLSYAAG